MKITDKKVAIISAILLVIAMLGILPTIVEFIILYAIIAFNVGYIVARTTTWGRYK